MSDRWEYRHTVFALAFLAWFSVRGSRIAIGAVAPEITTTFAASNEELGLAVTVLTIGYAATQLPGGVLADRYGERRVIVGSLLLTGVGTFLMAISPSFLGFFVFAFLFGIGTGLYRPPAESFLERIFENPDGAISGHAAGGAVSGIVVPSAAIGIASVFSWRLSISLGGVVAVVIATTFLVVGRPVPDGGSSIGTHIDRSAIRSFFASPAVLYTTGVGILGTFTFEAFLTFFPSFLIEYRGLAPGRAGVVFGVAALFAIVGLFGNGYLSERYVRRDVTLMSIFGIGATGYAVILIVPHQEVVWAGAVLVGIGLSWSGLVTARFLSIEMDIGQGSGLGLHKTAVLLVGSLGSVVVGALADAGGWELAFGTLVVVLLFVLASLAVVQLSRFDV